MLAMVHFGSVVPMNFTGMTCWLADRTENLGSHFLISFGGKRLERPDAVTEVPESMWASQVTWDVPAAAKLVLMANELVLTVWCRQHLWLGRRRWW